MSRFAVSGPLFRHLRCVAVSAPVNGTGSLVDLLLTWDGLLLRLAVTVLLPVNLCETFPPHGRVTFAWIGRGRATRLRLRLLAVMLTGYALNLAFLTILVDGAGVPHQLAQLGSIGLIAVVMFQLMRRDVFVHPPSDRPAR